MRTTAAAVAAAFCAAAAPVRVEVDKEKSYLAAGTDKGGLLSFAAGHRHGILAMQWTAEVCYDPADPPASRARIDVAAAALQIDTPEARRRAALSAGGPGERERDEIQRKLLAPENLAVADHPAIRFRTASVESSGAGRLLVRGRLDIRDRSRTVAVPVFVAENGAEVRFSGAFTLRQSDYGIRPASVAGVVRVKDAVRVLFEIAGRLTGTACR